MNGKHYRGVVEVASRVYKGALEIEASLSGAYLCDRRGEGRGVEMKG